MSQTKKLPQNLKFSVDLKNTIPIHFSAKRPRLGTIMKNHIQSSSGLFRTALFVCSESDTSLMNCITSRLPFTSLIYIR